jgi:hypothetical protein
VSKQFRQMQIYLVQLLQTIEEYWQITNYEVEKSTLERDAEIRTRWSSTTVLLPNTKRVIRGLEGVSVDKVDKSKDLIYMLIDKAIKPLEDWQLKSQKSEVIEIKTLISDYIDKLLVEFNEVPKLNERIFDSVGFKHDEPDELPLWIEGLEPSMSRIIKTSALKKILTKELKKFDFDGKSQISLENKQKVAEGVIQELSILSNRTHNLYKAIILLNAPLVDEEDCVSLGEIDFDRIKFELYISYADDDLLSKFKSVDINTLENVNTVCSFSVGIKVDASVNTYLYIYELAGKVAEKLVDSLRLVCEHDVGVLGLEVIPDESFTPRIRKTFETRYQQNLAPILPKRFHYHLNSLKPIHQSETEQVKFLINSDWYSNSVKGIDIAIKRFRSSIERYMPDDPEKLLDLSISFEAIYLNDGDNKELTYRLALRAARLLGNSVEERQGIFKVLKDLYKYRSKVAHGENLETLRESDKKRLSNVLAQAPLILKRSIIGMLSGNGPKGLKDNEKIGEWWSKLELQ